MLQSTYIMQSVLHSLMVWFDLMQLFPSYKTVHYVLCGYFTVSCFIHGSHVRFLFSVSRTCYAFSHQRIIQGVGLRFLPNIPLIAGFLLWTIKEGVARALFIVLRRGRKCRGTVHVVVEFQLEVLCNTQICPTNLCELSEGVAIVSISKSLSYTKFQFTCLCLQFPVHRQ